MNVDSLENLKITANRIKLLNNMHIFTIRDLVSYFPYRYEILDETTLNDEKVCIEGTIIDEPRVFYKGRMSRMTFSINYQNNNLKVVIFNRHFLKHNMEVGMVVTIVGKYNLVNNTITASDMKLKPINEVMGIKPVYSLKEGISQTSFLNYVKKALKYYHGHIKDDIPLPLLNKHKLISREKAYNDIHTGTTKEDIKQAIKYLKYEEFLKFQLTMQYIREQRTSETGNKKEFDMKDVNDFINNLPFELTTDQKRVVDDIINDLKEDKTMYRFIQGDVGSGKTIVSIIGLYCNYLAGYQGAMMAPTEILASQHIKTLQKIFSNYDINITLLTGSLSVKEKQAIYDDLENGLIDIVVGTHALFQEKVTFSRLGLVITDEQHRFGVEQRKALKNKGEKVDFLVMSATPIPRTLAISLYGDMDVSTIKTKPVGRKEIISEVLYTKSMKPILNKLTDYLDCGGQCYVICPLVDESETIDSRNAIAIYEAMQRYFKDKYQVGLLHGKMDDQEKEDIMQAFKDNKYQILVSTTVIEVGVDVSNANMMVIYNSERFGLSQLHQLRGRIGRGSHQGYCYFLAGSKTEDVKERLEFLKNTSDGFEISMFDLKRRGPGEILGNKQSGVPTFHIGDVFKDLNILEVARNDSKDIIDEVIDDERSKKLLETIQHNLQKNNVYID